MGCVSSSAILVTVSTFSEFGVISRDSKPGAALTAPSGPSVEQPSGSIILCRLPYFARLD